jgi:pimeloyl-ACP methyl ester carboxylesterase
MATPSTRKTFLLHGGPGLKKDYLAGHFDNWSGRSVITVDYPGCETGKGQDVGLEDVLGAIKRVAPPGADFDVIAHSWGAFLLMELLRRHSGWTSGKIVLISPFPTSSDSFFDCGKVFDKLKTERLSAERIARLEALAADRGGRNDFEYIKIIEPLYVHRPELAPRVGFNFYNRSLEDRMCQFMQGFDHREIVEQVSNRTMIVLGKEDFIQPRHLQPWEKVVERIEVMDEVGHCPHLEAPDIFFRIVEEFLA